MVKVGFLFAGQGAQAVGMGRDVYEASASARAIFDKANNITQSDIANLCFNGPQELLTQTINAQVAIFTTSVAILEVIKERFPQLKPSLNCGLSLGEYSALVSAGILDFETALGIVKKRGELMERAAAENPGGMVSIIGLGEEQCREVAQECDVDVANYNSPEQIVLSGLKQNVETARDSALAKGAKKGIILNVSGAFHSRYMNSAAHGMKDILSGAMLKQPTSGFIPNVKGVFENNVDEIKNDLVQQVSNSVKWTHTMQFASSQGAKHFLEIGVGKVLKGLARRIDKDLSVLSVENMKQIEEIGEFVK